MHVVNYLLICNTQADGDEMSTKTVTVCNIYIHLIIPMICISFKQLTYSLLRMPYGVSCPGVIAESSLRKKSVDLLQVLLCVLPSSVLVVERSRLYGAGY